MQLKMTITDKSKRLSFSTQLTYLQLTKETRNIMNVKNEIYKKNDEE